MVPSGPLVIESYPSDLKEFGYRGDCFVYTGQERKKKGLSREITGDLMTVKMKKEIKKQEEKERERERERERVRERERERECVCERRED